MRAVLQIIEYAATFTEFFVFYRILDVMFRARRKNGAVYPGMIAAFAGAVLIFLCNRMVLFSYASIAAAGVFMTVSAYLLFELDAVSAFSMASFYLLCLNCFDFLVLTLLSGFCGGADLLETVLADMGAARAGIVTLVKGLWLLLYFVLKKYLEKLSGHIRGTGFLMGTSAAGFAGFVYLANQSRRAFQTTVPLLWFGVVCLLAALIFLGYFKSVNQEQKWRLETLRMRNRLLNESYQEMHEIYEENAKLYHDLNNHLNVLYQLVNGGKMEEAGSYIREISSPVRKLSKRMWTGSSVVDAVINSKQHRMEELGIRSEIHTELPLRGGILASDMCIILSNLLDNAIEAASQCRGAEPPCIRLTIRCIHHFLLIRIINPLAKAPQQNSASGRLQTTKEKKQEHGWGLESVRTAVEKYCGTLEQEWNDERFETTVLLFFDKEEAPEK